MVARWQLLAVGYLDGAIKHRVAAGRLHRKYPGVYAVGHRTLTRKGHWMAAVLAYGEGAVLSHRTAAALWELRPTAQAKVDVTEPGGSRRCRANLRIHRARVLHPEDHAVRDGIPVTSVARTVFDLAPLLSDDQLTRAIEEADRKQLFDLGALDRAIARTPRRRGVRRLKRVLAAYRDPKDLRSGNERRLLMRLRKRGVPEPQTNVLVAGKLVDFFWPDAMLVVELDSPAYHSSPRVFERDRVSDAVLQRNGCRVLRVTEKRVRHQVDRAVDDIIALRGLRPPLG